MKPISQKDLNQFILNSARTIILGNQLIDPILIEVEDSKPLPSFYLIPKKLTKELNFPVTYSHFSRANDQNKHFIHIHPSVVVVDLNPHILEPAKTRLLYQSYYKTLIIFQGYKKDMADHQFHLSQARFLEKFVLNRNKDLIQEKMKHLFNVLK